MPGPWKNRVSPRAPRLRIGGAAIVDVDAAGLDQASRLALRRYELDLGHQVDDRDAVRDSGPIQDVRFHLTMKTSTTEEITRLTVAVLQQQLRQVQIALDIRTFEFATFYSDVLVPDSARIGGVDAGWPVMKVALVYERGVGGAASLEQTVSRDLAAWARGARRFWKGFTEPPR